MFFPWCIILYYVTNQESHQSAITIEDSSGGNVTALWHYTILDQVTAYPMQAFMICLDHHSSQERIHPVGEYSSGKWGFIWWVMLKHLDTIPLLTKSLHTQCWHPLFMSGPPLFTKEDLSCGRLREDTSGKLRFIWQVSIHLAGHVTRSDTIPYSQDIGL